MVTKRQMVVLTELLNEYKDIIADDIPNGLPPVRSISHCMDLIPRASLPNKAPYRLTPTDNEEFNRQVHDQRKFESMFYTYYIST